MHELSICQALIGQVEAVAGAEHASAVSDIFVSVGPLAGVEPPLMQNAFPLAAAGTVASAATLHLNFTPIRVTCGKCGKESEVPANRLVCKHCGDWRTQLLSGDELLLKRVVLDREHAGERRHV